MASSRMPPPGDQNPNRNPKRVPKEYDETQPGWNLVPTYKSGDINKVRQNMGKAGMPRNPQAFVREAQRMAQNREVAEGVRKKLATFARPNTPPGHEHEASYWDAWIKGDMETANKEREKLSKTGNYILNNALMPGLGMGGMPVYTDPLNSPTRAGIPTWHQQMPPEERAIMQMMVRAWSRYFYRNHHLVPTCMNIYAKYPFVGIDLRHSDPAVESEYQVQFFDVLEYDELLPLASLQYWITGEAPMLAEWDSTFGGWSSEDILDPDHLEIRQWPKPGKAKESYFWLPPEDLIQLAKNGDPEDPIYRNLVDNYKPEEIEQFAKGHEFEIPAEHLTVLRHDQDMGGSRGYPILMRAFPQLMQEEKLNQALQAISERLYTPFVIAKLGGVDLPDGEVWVPDMEDVNAFQAYLEMVMVSRHRTMVWHSGVTFENPFGNMQIPNLNEDFARSDENVASVFGISLELIKGGSSGPYAAGALSAENMMQTLAASQRMWTQWWIKDRMTKVAEERGLYEVQRKGLQMVHPLEKVIEIDEETGKKRVRTRQKLALASIHLESIDWRDEQNIFNNMMQLRREGVFISDGLMLQKADPDLDPEAVWQDWEQEQIRKHQIRQNLESQGITPEQGQQAGGPGGGGGGAGGGAVRPPGAGRQDNPMPGGGNTPPQSGDQREGMPAAQGQGAGQAETTPRAASLRVVDEGDSREGIEVSNIEPESQRYVDRVRGFTPLTRRGKRIGTIYYSENGKIKSRPAS